MTTLGTQLDKIRSDAAECMLLSKLVPDGKGQVFVRTAEHLNELVLELEKSVAINRADAGADRGSLSAPQFRDHGDAASITAGQPPAPRRRMLTWIFLAVIVVSGVLAASSRQAREYWSQYVSHARNDAPPSTQDQTLTAMSALLSGAQAEREKVIGRLDELKARMDVLVSSLNHLNSARNEALARLDKAAEEESRSSVSQAPAPGLKSSPRENAARAPEGSFAAKQADNLPPDTADRVGSVPAGQRRAEPSSRKQAAGPAGCTQFRSYDPASETYTTLDGRRRECRQ